MAKVIFHSIARVQLLSSHTTQTDKQGTNRGQTGDRQGTDRGPTGDRQGTDRGPTGDR
jgi:hypothetical protein